MRIQVESDDRSRAVEVSFDQGATVADLSDALGLGESAEIDGVSVPSSARIADVGLVEGSIVRRPGAGATASDRSTRTGLVVGVVAGPDAGRVRAIDETPMRIGRDETNDLAIDNPTVSAAHVELVADVADPPRVLVTDLGSRNGTWIDGATGPGRRPLTIGQDARLGSSRLSLRSIAAREPRGGRSPALDRGPDGRVLVNRPPRRPVPAAPEAIEAPVEPPDEPSPSLPVAALAVPLLVALVLVVALGPWRYALFAALSPLVLIGNHLGARRRAHARNRTESARHRERLADFGRRMADARTAERIRRRELAPDLVEVRRRFVEADPQLWERRLWSTDALTAGLGRGAVPWQPSAVADGAGERVEGEAARLLEDMSVLDDTEIVADLRRGVLGVVGSHSERAALARSVVLQLCCHHGPADLRVAVLTSNDRIRDWAFAQWLPHSVEGSGAVSVLAGTAIEPFSERLADSLADSLGESAGCWLLVVDDAELLHRRRSPLRALLGRESDRLAAIVLAATREQLPASTRTVATIADASGAMAVDLTDASDHPTAGVADLPALDSCGEIARAAARYDDPESDVVPTASSLDVPRWANGDAADLRESVQRRWRARESTSLAASIGLTADGEVDVDLVRDGPHALIAGTTGSGKSELLRTLVVGLAAHHHPEELAFALIDYKGGSAFDPCASLPHVVGVVTDLDAHLARRALIALEAEVRRREELLRAAKVASLVDYRREGSELGPLPRLVVIVDEFATLRAELPSFVDSLVGIAQRGRSLGLHLVLATQRPSGTVDASIRANTNLRISLRVQDPADSRDVIDVPDAAYLDSAEPGLALLRRGSEPPTTFRVASLSTSSRHQGPIVRVAEIMLGAGLPPEPAAAPVLPSTVLDLVVRSISEVRVERPSRPWLDELPDSVTLDELGDLESIDDAPIRLAMGDEPARQRRVACGWDPDAGPLVVHGMAGSGVTTLLRTAITQLGSFERAVWVYPVDHGAGGLTGIDALPFVERPIVSGDDERHGRLLDMLELWVEERRAAGGKRHDRPLVVVAIDGLAAFLDALDAITEGGDAATSRFARIIRDGAPVGVTAMLGAGPPRDLPRMMASHVKQRWVLELAASEDYGLLGLRVGELPAFTPGRVLIGAEPLVAHVAVSRTSPSARRPPPGWAIPEPVEPLAEVVSRSDLQATARVSADLDIPMGLLDRTREPASLQLRSGEHALVAGPRGSGRSTLLRTIARQLRAADESLVLVWVSGNGDDGTPAEAVDASGSVHDLTEVLGAAPSDGRRWVVLIDDADRIADQPELVDLLRPGLERVFVVAAALNSSARNGYGHWLRHVRTSGVGVLLTPDTDLDGEILGVRLPRSQPIRSLPGRGYLVRSGVPTVVHVAV